MEDQEIIIRTLEKEKELLQKQLSKKNDEIVNMARNNEILIDQLKKENKDLSQKLETILCSSSYKFIQKVKNLLNKLKWRK